MSEHRRLGIVFLVSLLAVLMSSGVCYAAAPEVWVSPTGNDANPGTSSQPVQTIGRGLDLVDPGGIMYLTAGQHSVPNLITISKSVTLRGDGITATIVDGLNRTDGRGPFSVTINGNLTFENMTIQRPGGATGVSARAISVTGMTNPGVLTIRNVRFIGRSTTDIADTGIVVMAPVALVVEGCEFQGFRTAIALVSTTASATISNCNFHDLRGVGTRTVRAIQVSTSSGINVTAPITIQNNTFTNFDSTAIYVYSDPDVNGSYAGTLSGLEIRGNTFNIPFASDTQITGVIDFDNRGADSTQQQNRGIRGATIFGNTITGTSVPNHYGIKLAGNNSGITIEQNSITGVDTAIMNSQAQSFSTTGLRVKNNFIAGNGQGIVNSLPANTIDATTNWWGSANGPSHPSNTLPGPKGDSVTDGVMYTPWWSSISGQPGSYTGQTSSSGPIIASLTPNHGSQAGGYTVEINGSGFGTSPTVAFASTPATVVSASDTRITVTAPAGMGVVPVIVTAGGVNGTPATFTYDAPQTLTEVWVSTSGNDANAGTQASPVQTINRGIALVASGGRVNVAAGTYLTSQVLIDKPLRLIGAGASSTIVDGQNASGLPSDRSATIVDQAAGDVIIEGFTFRRPIAATRAYSVAIRDGQPGTTAVTTIQNCTFLGRDPADIEDGGITLNQPKRVIIRNNTFDNVVRAVWMSTPINGVEVSQNTFVNLGKAFARSGRGIHIYTMGRDVPPLIKIDANTFANYYGSAVSAEFEADNSGFTFKGFIQNLEITNNTISINQSALESDSSAVRAAINFYNYGADVTQQQNRGVSKALVAGNTITGAGLQNKYAVRVAGYHGNIEIRNNLIKGHDVGIKIEQAQGVSPYNISASQNSINCNLNYGALNSCPDIQLAATNNWWGSTNGPQHPTNTSSGPKGDRISDRVVYVPWWIGITGAPGSYTSATPPVTKPPLIAEPANPIIVNLASYTIRGTAEEASLVEVWADTNSNGVVDSGEMLIGSRQLTVGSCVFEITVPLIQDCSQSMIVTARSAGMGVSPATIVPIITEDSTPPALTWGTPVQMPNQAGWYKSAIQIPFTVVDSLSGVEYTSLASPVTLDVDGVDVKATVSATDRAGNTVSYTSPGFKIDTIAPVTTTSVAPSPGSGGWSKVPLVVSMSATDLLSGVAGTEYRIDAGNWATYTAPVVIDSDGDHVISYRSTDKAGNIENAKGVHAKIDKTPPTIVITGNAGIYTADQTISIICSATDSLSGVASISRITIGGAAYTYAIGPNSIPVTAKDNMGNEVTVTVTFTVTSSTDAISKLVQVFCDKPGVIASLKEQLVSIQDALAKGNPNSVAGKTKALINHIEAQTGKSIPADKAKVLIELIRKIR